MAISAVDSITPAVEHTRQQLFTPFRIDQWTKLALVGMLAGELGIGGFNRSNFMPSHSGGTPHFPGMPGIDMALLLGLIGVAIVAGLAIGTILMYVSSVMRFILFDSVIARECHIRAGWSRRLDAGWRYFAWKFVYFLVFLLIVGTLIGGPLAWAISEKWYYDPKAHLPALIACGAVIFAVLLFLGLITAVVMVLTKDFVVPQMALEDIGAVEGWRRLWPMMKSEMGAYIAYVAMKIVLAVVVGALIAIASVIVSLIYAVPAVMLGLLAVFGGKAAGMVWTPATIALAVAMGCVLLAGFLYVVSLISVPAIVFFPAYSIYFFAGRYPPLAAAVSSGSYASGVSGTMPIR